MSEGEGFGDPDRVMGQRASPSLYQILNRMLLQLDYPIKKSFVGLAWIARHMHECSCKDPLRPLLVVQHL